MMCNCLIKIKMLDLPKRLTRYENNKKQVKENHAKDYE